MELSPFSLSPLAPVARFWPSWISLASLSPEIWLRNAPPLALMTPLPANISLLTLSSPPLRVVLVAPPFSSAPCNAQVPLLTFRWLKLM